MAEKHWVSEENLQAYHTKVVGSKTDKTADPNGTIYQRLNAQKETIGHLLILKITFSEEFKGKAYTVTGNGETFTGTVPNSLYINLYVHGLDSIYTVSAEYEGVLYSNEVETKDFYGVYFGELTAWQATITVIVTDAVAGAVEGALVTATSTEKEYTQTTNAEGKAKIKVGKSGTYTIVAKNADGELTDTQEVVADTDKGAYIAEVSYWRATLTVTVTDKGVGVAGAKVTAASADKTYGPVATDAEGKVTIKIGKAGTYTVTATNSAGEETNPKTVEVTTAGETYTVILNYLVAVAWSNGSDEDVTTMIQQARDGLLSLSDYWAVGDERTVHISAITSGTVSALPEMDVKFVILNFGGVPLTDGTECLAVVGMKEGLTPNHSDGNGQMNTSDTNSGSWNSSYRRSWCNSTFYNVLPEYFQNILKKMNTQTPSSGTSSTFQTSEDMIAIPAPSQIWSKSEGSSGNQLNMNEFNGTLTQFEYFKTTANRTGLSSMWTRTPSAYSDCFTQVHPTTLLGGPEHPTSKRVIIPFGCI